MMKDEAFIEAYESIVRIEELLSEAEVLFDSLPVRIQQVVMDCYSGPGTIQHCIPEYIQAVKKFCRDFYEITMNNSVKSNVELTEIEKLTVRFTNPMLLDRLHILAVEYSISTELLVNAAVMHLIDNVDFMRNLRVGIMELK